MTTRFKTLNTISHKPFNIQKETLDPETEREFNELSNMFAEGFIAKIYSDGIVKEVSAETILNYLANPDNYIREMQNLAMYYYISNGEVFQLFDLAKTLPTLNYKIDCIDKIKTYEKNLKKCTKALNKVKHKPLTRDLISQLVSSGTVTGIWLGDATNPYLYVFDNVKYFFPNYRLYGNWVITMDMSYLDTITEQDKNAFYRNLSPYITKSTYDTYKANMIENRYVDLPTDRTICLRTHTLNRSQAFGINWSTQGMFDLNHKKKLKDLEKAIANKIISAIAVLTIGSKDKPEQFGNLKLNKDLKKKIYSGVKTALEKNQTQGVTVIGVPEFADIKFPEMKSDALMPEKFTSINNDITSAYGVSSALTNGTGSNFASAKINLDVFYKRIAVILEDIESEVYSKLFRIILSKTLADDYLMVYDKEIPLSAKEKVDYLFKLHAEGFAVKHIIDSLSGIEFTEYLEQSVYEQEVLKIPEKIKPYMTAYTNNGTNGANPSGAPTKDNTDNPNTVASKANDGNNLPSS